MIKFVMLTSALDDWMFASGCGNAWVGDHGILTKLATRCNASSLQLT